ncbi:hypothetical protein N7517_004000 [Penicillium concentricum]|uniref:Uncharacterized protein n=1 Tax=Penicillium concentricum TaxID=293559 RepID=A0A9W9V8Z3_9EURO|nr:uncharacterized protein N7517_004000 [Penicillium concentricum]KAJ5371994.1 hypothetical protein N7517_004000 [Penicillium concentricum]
MASLNFRIRPSDRKRCIVHLELVEASRDSKCQILHKRVKHRLNKRKRNKGRNDKLGLCVIQEVLEYAFLDNAVASEHIKCPRNI